MENKDLEKKSRGVFCKKKKFRSLYHVYKIGHLCGACKIDNGVHQRRFSVMLHVTIIISSLNLPTNCPNGRESSRMITLATVVRAIILPPVRRNESIDKVEQ